MVCLNNRNLKELPRVDRWQHPGATIGVKGARIVGQNWWHPEAQCGPFD